MEIPVDLGTTPESSLDVDIDLGHPTFWEKLVVLGMAVAAFGPYISGSVRTEQAVVYSLFLLVSVRALRVWPSKCGRMLFIATVGALASSMFGVAFPSSQTPLYEPGSLYAGLDNMALPVAVLVIVWVVVPSDHAISLLGTYARVIVWATAFNGALAVVSTRIDLSGTLRAFWAPEGAGQTVADRAEQGGRFSGIFNQPAEAGLMYGIAALLAVFCYKNDTKKLLLALSFITVGGLICISKVFILCGLPLTILYLLRTTSLSKKVSFTVAGVIVFLGLGQTGFIQSWVGVGSLTNILSPGSRGLVDHFSAGRWNSGSHVQTLITDALANSPIAGVGAGGWETGYDSGWTQAIVIGGIIGVVLHVIMMLSVLQLAKRMIDVDRRNLTLMVGLLLIGADLGIPAFTANRDATVVWILLALLCLVESHTRKDKFGQRANSDHRIRAKTLIK